MNAKFMGIVGLHRLRRMNLLKQTVLVAVVAASMSTFGAIPLLAEGTSVQQTFKSSTAWVKTIPLTKVAACLPDGSSCSKGGDCCDGICDSKHNKCGR
jgi:hypothetical protein